MARIPCQRQNRVACDRNDPRNHPSAMTRIQRVSLVLGAIGFVVVAWETATTFIAYTDDAYVRSDLVAVAPQVTGPIVGLYVTDNQTVHRGDRLFTIDPVPFRLTLAQRQAARDEAIAQVAADHETIRVAQDQLATAGANEAFARQTQSRLVRLVVTDDASQQSLDRANDDLRVAEAALSSARAQLDRAQVNLAQHEAAQKQAEAELAYAQWQLSQTDVRSPTDGAVNLLTLRVGDMARENVPAIGIVDAHAWRVMANYKQYYLPDFRIGQTAWVWLDADPWHLHRARIQGIARGISREPDTVKLLPYVAPTTDWIRLQRRFPVTLLLDDAASLPLYMGSDARTVIFP